jgi:hypothetical protein
LIFDGIEGDAFAVRGIAVQEKSLGECKCGASTADGTTDAKSDAASC